MSTHLWLCSLTAVILTCLPRLEAAGGPACRAYRGGGLVVTDPALHPGHLAPGQVLPIRLSRLLPPGPGLPPLQGSEAPGSVRYGQLVFQRVSPSSITFTVAFREAGALGPARTITLLPGDGADLTGDGLQDVVFQAPAKALTAGSAAIDYALLAFPCDAAHASTFALAPGAFPGAKYPYGISGVTPSGEFIFLWDGPAACAGECLVEPGPGDVMVEARSGRFGRIEQVRRTLAGLDLEYARPGTPDLFREVFGAAFVRVSGDLGHLRRGFAQEWERQANLVDVAFTQPLMDNAYGKLDVEVAARLSATIDLSASVTFCGLSAQVAVDVDETLRLAADCLSSRPWSQSFGPLILAAPEFGFAVDGVPLVFSLEVSAGLDLDNQDTGTALQGVSSAGHWGWSASLAASWGWRGVQVNAPDPVAASSLVFQGLPENQNQMQGRASIRPWLIIKPRIGFSSLLYAECPNSLALSCTASSAPPSIRAREDVSYQLNAGFSLDLPLLGSVWARAWPVYSWSDTLWSN